MAVTVKLLIILLVPLISVFDCITFPFSSTFLLGYRLPASMRGNSRKKKDEKTAGEIAIASSSWE
jgi:hypothetical protein